MNNLFRTCRTVWTLLAATIAIVKEPDHLQILHSYRRDWMPTTFHHPYSFNSAMATAITAIAANTPQINCPLVRQCQTALLSCINCCIMVVDRNHLPSAPVLQRPSAAGPRIVVVVAFVAFKEAPLFGKDLAGI